MNTEVASAWQVGTTQASSKAQGCQERPLGLSHISAPKAKRALEVRGEGRGIFAACSEGPSPSRPQEKLPAQLASLPQMPASWAWHLGAAGKQLEPPPLLTGTQGLRECFAGWHWAGTHQGLVPSTCSHKGGTPGHPAQP